MNENRGQLVMDWTVLCLSYQKVKPESFPVVSLGSQGDKYRRIQKEKFIRKPISVFLLEWEDGESYEVCGVEEIMEEGLGYRVEYRFGREIKRPFKLSSGDHFRGKGKWWDVGRWMETQEGRRVFVRRVGKKGQK